MAVTPPTSSQTAAAGAQEKPPPPSGGLIFCCLIVLLALCVGLLAHTRLEPLENNMPQYALIGHEMRGGRLLYTDIFDQKPPAIYGTFLLAERAFGYGRPTLFFLQAIAAGVTLLGVYAAGAALTQDRRYGLLGAAGYALACGDVVIQANQPNAEVFINACLVWGFALLVGAKLKPLGFFASLVTGVLFALATLYKPNVGVVPLLLLAVYVLFPPGGKANRSAAVGNTLVILGVIVTAWAGVCLYFALHGRFWRFLLCRDYVQPCIQRQPGLEPAERPEPQPLGRPFFPPVFHFVFADASHRLLSLKSSLRSSWLLLWAFVLGAYIAVILPGVYLPYYYALLLPPLMVGLSWAASTLVQARPPQTRIVGLLLGMACVGLIVWREAKFQRLSVNEISILKYSNDIFINADVVAHRINTLLLPNEIFYDASTNPELYFTAKRPMQYGVFYSEATVKGPRAEQFADCVITSLERRPPELISLREAYHMTPADYRNPRIFAWIQQRYEPLPPQLQTAPFVLLMRKGGILSRRLALNPVYKQSPASKPDKKPTTPIQKPIAAKTMRRR